MKRAAFLTATTAIIVIAFASLASAGVVISQTEEKAGPGGQTAEDRTIYVQGNKEKIDSPRTQTIADLDRHVLYVVDVSRRVYAEVPLRAVQQPAEPGGSSAAGSVRLQRTGVTRNVGAYPCQEYRGGGGNGAGRLSVSACVSKQAPGANEVAQFDRNMMEQLTGASPQSFAKDASAGMVLEENSVLQVRVPQSSSQDHSAGELSVTSKRRVNDIKVKQLPAAFFKPPEGFNKVERNSNGNSI